MAEAARERSARHAGIAAHPYSALFLPVPIVCFVGAFLTDLTYANSEGNLQWLNFSSWLLAAGLLFAGLAGLLMIIDLVRLPQLRNRFGWGAFGLLVVAAIIEFINSLIHARDGWTAVVPTGLALSAIGAVLVMSYGWLWHETRYVAGSRP
jgi:uncharacterized membrane protein